MQIPAPPYESCKELIDNVIPQDVSASVFGPDGQAGVEYPIPKGYISSKIIMLMFERTNGLREAAGDGRCMAFVLARGVQITRTEASWRGIWEDIVAMNELCVKQHNEPGMAIIHGKLLSLISKENPLIHRTSKFGSVRSVHYLSESG